MHIFVKVDLENITSPVYLYLVDTLSDELFAPFNPRKRERSDSVHQVLSVSGGLLGLIKGSRGSNLRFLEEVHDVHIRDIPPSCNNPMKFVPITFWGPPTKVAEVHYSIMLLAQQVPILL